MKRLILSLLTVLLIEVSSAQTLTKNYVDAWISATFPGAEIDDEVVYVLNGHVIPIDSLSFLLSKYQTQDLTGINYIDRTTISNAILCIPPTGVVILQTKGTQSKKLIKEYFGEAKRKYQQPPVIVTADIAPKSGEPVLIVNGKQIFRKEAYNMIQNIKLNKIIGINIINRPVAKSIYGENAPNGLIVITTY
ncbi:hypothetical protein [Pedobacter sp. SYSU D00535]|uniref:hypothetical protein n=1 Tax=Pedobacter sp. SYSU D00535 TaxID=2810308 RepID=UPI001A96DEEB|nr:hypothetical protein [Pedobacter sp. SYSU D00535]